MSLSPVVHPLRTDAELSELKANWLSDPCWDIEDAEGFEAHRHELAAFRLQHKVEWQRCVELDAARYGVTPAGLAYIRALERRIEKLEGVVQP